MSIINNLNNKVQDFMLVGGGKILGGNFKNLKDIKHDSINFMKDVEKNPEKHFGDGNGNKSIDPSQLKNFSSNLKPEGISGDSNLKFPPIK